MGNTSSARKLAGNGLPVTGRRIEPKSSPRSESPESANRYEKERPGQLIHLEGKRLVKLKRGAGTGKPKTAPAILPVARNQGRESEDRQPAGPHLFQPCCGCTARNPISKPQGSFRLSSVVGPTARTIDPELYYSSPPEQPGWLLGLEPDQNLARRLSLLQQTVSVSNVLQRKLFSNHWFEVATPQMLSGLHGGVHICNS